MKINEYKVLPHHAEEEESNLRWIRMQDNKLELEAQALVLVEKLQEKLAALEEEKRHMQCQQYKPEEKAKQAAINAEKQKPKWKKPKVSKSN
jgi:type IV secretory pathway VirJ component